jgi:GDPmannose 4,6-dehydratase
MYACNGILFNHESPRRGETFVTRKITRAAVRIAVGQQHKLFLGNINAKRDWGHAKDYVRGMWLMLQQDQPEDFVMATGETTTVRAFCEMAFHCLGIEIGWKGQGVNEKGFVNFLNKEKFDSRISKSFDDLKLSKGDIIIEVDPEYFRPTEVDILLGDAEKARKKLGWEPEFDVKELVRDMTIQDLQSFIK